MTEEELRILAWTILGEAGGEGLAGMTAVAHVIRNRAMSGRYPSNPAAVALQNNGSEYHQFSTWNAIDKGGNLPRAQYPVGSNSFTRALGVINQVFGGTPGKDPTGGATHYYAPRGMADGAAPWWWRAEPKIEERRIGAHVFAVKREDAVAPTPATQSRPMSYAGQEAARDRRVRLPELAPPPVLPGTALAQEQALSGGSTAGAKLTDYVYNSSTGQLEKKLTVSDRVRAAGSGTAKRQEQNLSGGNTSGAVYTDYIYDPVTGSLKPKSASISDMVRAAQSAKQPAKTTQVVAGGFTGKLTLTATSYVGQDTYPNTTTTKFAAPVVAQPAGSVKTDKGQERLAPGEFLEPRFAVDSRGYSRDGAARRAAGEAAVAAGVLNGLERKAPPPMPIPRPVAQPPAPVRIVVQRDPVAKTIAQPVSAVQAFRDKGLSPADAYDAANAAAEQRARDNAGSSGYSNITSPGGQRYDARSGTWV